MKRLLEVLRLRKPRGEVVVSAVVIRADGTREPLGVIGRGSMEMDAGSKTSTGPSSGAFLLGDPGGGGGG